MSHAPSPGTLDVSNVHKSFGAHQVLKGITFTVEPGQMLGFVGSNGAGKTTTMRIILNILQPDQGHVTLAGKPIGTRERAQIGYMPEERGLYPKMKVEEQLTYLARLHGLSKHDARKASEHWMERLGVSERRADAVEKLSLGNQQRVQLASALVFNPIALVLDEPFSGLDPVAVEVMSTALQEQAARGLPVLFSSHQLDLVERLCNKVVILKDGIVSAQGSVSELRRQATTPKMILRGDESACAAGTTQAATLGVHFTQSDSRDTGIITFAIDEKDERASQILTAASRSGAVWAWQSYTPTLTELYRDLVSTPATSDTTQAR